LKPKALDLFCGAGGASMGLHQAGFDVTGVDIKPQPRYPFTFIQADAITFPLEGFDFIWASPPCQKHSAFKHLHPQRKYECFIERTRERLSICGGLWVIENVPGAPLRDPAILCGAMFGLDTYRHRLFETSFDWAVPEHPAHDRPASSAGHFREGTLISIAGNFAPVAVARAAMGIDWMIRNELSQAIPPAYSRYIGEQIMQRVLESRKVPA
jgi:DNA (cytosine-5)-methyltransferase 1